MVQSISDKLDSLVQSLTTGQNRPAAGPPAPASGKPSAVQAQPPVDVNNPAIAAAVEKVGKELQASNNHLSLSVDKDTNRILIRYKDPHGEVVRQIPSDAVLEMVKRLDKFKGMVLNSQG